MTFDIKELDRLYKKLKEHSVDSKHYKVYQEAIVHIESLVRRDWGAIIKFSIEPWKGDTNARNLSLVS